MSPALLDHLRQAFDFDHWPAPDDVEPKLFFWRLSLGEVELFGAKLLRIEQRKLGGDVYLIRTMWAVHTKKGETLLRLDIYVCPSQSVARERLLELLGNFQSPLVASREEPDIGEVVFGPPNLGSLVYLRGNLAIFLANAGGVTLPMDGFAKLLNKFLMEAPADVAGRLPPTIHLDLKVQKRHPKETPLVLALEVDDPLGMSCWCRIESQIGEVSMHDGTLAYQSPRSGKETLRICAVAPDGRSVQIEKKFTVG